MAKYFSAGTGLLFFLSLLFSSCNSSGDTKVLIETEYGNMTFRLYNDTPRHKDNFIKLAEEGFYDGLEFHRVIEGFMIQGGDPVSRNAGPEVQLGGGGPGYTLPAEIGRPHYKGALAAARLGNHVNPDKESSGSQFYIVQGAKIEQNNLEWKAIPKGIKYSEKQIKTYTELGGTPDLDNEYTVFGEIIDGMEVIDKIAAVPTDPNSRPVSPVRMKVKVVK